MEIIDLVPEYEDPYCVCLEGWSAEMKEAGDLKKKWLEKKKEQGLRVKLAKNENSEIVGMIQYIPVKNAPVKGSGLYYIYCIWVHGYKEGVGNYQDQGIGKLLISAAEKDCREKGAKGIAAWGIMLPFFMRSKWFRKHGYKKADRDGMIELVWKPFAEDAAPPSLRRLKKRPVKKEGIVSVTCLRSGWCPAQNLGVERIKRALRELPGPTDYREIDTEDRANLEEWGVSDGIFIDGKPLHAGPPPSYEKLKRMLTKRIKRL